MEKVAGAALSSRPFHCATLYYPAGPTSLVEKNLPPQYIKLQHCLPQRHRIVPVHKGCLHDRTRSVFRNRIALAWESRHRHRDWRGAAWLPSPFKNCETWNNSPNMHPNTESFRGNSISGRGQQLETSPTASKRQKIIKNAGLGPPEQIWIPRQCKKVL